MNRSLVLALLAAVAVAAACGSPQATPPPPAAQPQAAAPAAADTVADVPDYPGAVRVASGPRAEVERGFARAFEASWTSADPYATVVAFYQKAIADRGWTVTSTESKATETEWRLARGTSVGKIEIKQGPGTQVTIKVERNDR